MLQAIPNPLVGGPQVEINFCGEIPMSELVGTNTQVGFFLGGFIFLRMEGSSFWRFFGGVSGGTEKGFFWG